MIFFGFLISAEYILNCLHFVIYNQQLSFILLGAATLVNDRYVAFDEIKFLEAEESHVETEVRAHFVDFVGV